MSVNTIRLRAMIGWLGTLLPWIVVLLLWRFPPSISSTYYEMQTNAVFMIILGSASFLLMSYKGYDKLDDVVMNLAGVFGLGVCLFPCTHRAYPTIGIFALSSNVSNIIHTVSAVAFFALLAFNSFFLFTKGNSKGNPKKKIRNVIYRVCGIGMIGSFAILLFPSFHIKVWLVETIALFFFGISFLTKADIYPWLFCDTPYTD